MLFFLYALPPSTLQYTHYTVYGSYYKSLILALKVNAVTLTIFGTLLGNFPTLCYILSSHGSKEKFLLEDRS